MPIKRVGPFSDRGNIKDLNQDLTQNPISNPATSFELRMKDLYERAERDRNVALMESLGFITMNQPGNKAAYPVTLIRHREKINGILAQRKEIINELAKEMAPAFARTEELPSEMRMSSMRRLGSLNAILDEPGIVKTASSASSGNRRSFRRIQ